MFVAYNVKHLSWSAFYSFSPILFYPSWLYFPMCPWLVYDTATPPTSWPTPWLLTPVLLHCNLFAMHWFAIGLPLRRQALEQRSSCCGMRFPCPSYICDFKCGSVQNILCKRMFQQRTFMDSNDFLCFWFVFILLMMFSTNCVHRNHFKHQIAHVKGVTVSRASLHCLYIVSYFTMYKVSYDLCFTK